MNAMDNLKIDKEALSVVSLSEKSGGQLTLKSDLKRLRSKKAND